MQQNTFIYLKHDGHRLVMDLDRQLVTPCFGLSDARALAEMLNSGELDRNKTKGGWYSFTLKFSEQPVK